MLPKSLQNYTVLTSAGVIAGGVGRHTQDVAPADVVKTLKVPAKAFPSVSAPLTSLAYPSFRGPLRHYTLFSEDLGHLLLPTNLWQQKIVSRISLCCHRNPHYVGYEHCSRDLPTLPPLSI
jgi:hypothetical protein